MVGKQERADLQQYKQIIFTVSISIFIVISRIRFGRTGRKHSNSRSYKKDLPRNTLLLLLLVPSLL